MVRGLGKRKGFLIASPKSIDCILMVEARVHRGQLHFLSLSSFNERTSKEKHIFVFKFNKCNYPGSKAYEIIDHRCPFVIVKLHLVKAEREIR